MANTFTSIYVHVIFHVKSTGIKILSKDLERTFAYIGGVINGIGGIPIEIGGITDHIHILASLPKNLALSDFVKTIKSDSSRWIKTIDKYYNRFSWQEGYGAFSVSSSSVIKTINYIRNQNEHHKTMTFREEYKSFLEAYGIKYDEKYAFDD
ncbi:MAG: transposase [Bacteroidales bacterium]|nr:transposase [Bacteroidales bacterium]